MCATFPFPPPHLDISLIFVPQILSFYVTSNVTAQSSSQYAMRYSQTPSRYLSVIPAFSLYRPITIDAPNSKICAQLYQIQNYYHITRQPLSAA